MSNPYHHPEFAAFVAAMRLNPDDRVTPLVCADWLEERGRGEHAKFIRGCVKIAELRDEVDECLKMDLHYTDPTRARPEREMMYLVNDLRWLIPAHCHAWTAGWVRSWGNPTVYDWPCGFLRSWSFCPYEYDSDHRLDGNARKKLSALLARQPIARVELKFPQGNYFSPQFVLDFHAAREFDQFPGLKFTHGNLSAAVPVKEDAA